jgi:anti-anti-sigma factor
MHPSQNFDLSPRDRSRPPGEIGTIGGSLIASPPITGEKDCVVDGSLMSEPSPFEVFITSAAAAASTVTVCGEIDLAAVPTLTASLEAAGLEQIPLDLDLSGITFIDSSGLHAIVQAHQRQQRAGLALTLRSPSPAVRRAIEMVALGDTLHIDEQRD